MNWQEVCEHPELKDLSFKIELNRQGQLVMTLVQVYNSVFKGEIAALLKAERKDGKVLTECAVRTHQGTKIADVAWVSADTFQRIKDEVECSVAPEVCIEVLSTSNTAEEMEDKRSLYFANGAKEVWMCDRQGHLRFYVPGAEREDSLLFPDFPAAIDYDS